MPNDISLFVYVFFLSGVAGLAALLRGKSEVTTSSVFASILNCGFIGLAISLFWYIHYKENLYGLVGICIMTGLGGLPVVEFLINLVKKLASKRFDDEGKNDSGSPLSPP